MRYLEEKTRGRWMSMEILGVEPSVDHRATLLQLLILCDRALHHPDQRMPLAGSLTAAAALLRTPTGTRIDAFLKRVATCAEATRNRIWTANAAPRDELARFAAKQAIGALQQFALTALGVLKGDVLLLER